jgi:pilus assembly protein CpaE
MTVALNALIIGQNETVSLDLRRRLVKAGIDCAAFVSAANESLEHTLGKLPVPPNVVFVRSDNVNGIDSALLPQIRRLTQADIIAVGSNNSSREILQLIRAGASDYLSDSEFFDDELTNLISRIKARTIKKNEAGKIISVVSASGGCGASTIAINLATAMAKKHIKNILIDLKQDGGDLASMLNLKPQHTLLDLSQQIDELDEEMLDKSLVDHHSGIRLLASSETYENAGLIHPEVVERVIQMAASKYGNVILDIEDVYHSEQLVTIRQSQIILIVIRLDFPCLVRVRRMLDYLERLGIPQDHIQLVVNRFGKKNELPKDTVMQALGKPFSYCLPEDFSLSALCANVGNPILLESPKSELAIKLAEMAEAITVLKEA